MSPPHSPTHTPDTSEKINCLHFGTFHNPGHSHSMAHKATRGPMATNLSNNLFRTRSAPLWCRGFHFGQPKGPPGKLRIDGKRRSSTKNENHTVSGSIPSQRALFPWIRCSKRLQALWAAGIGFQRSKGIPMNLECQSAELLAQDAQGILVWKL